MATPIRRTLRRIENPGHGRFLTFSCYRRLPLFANERIKDAFAKRLAMVKEQMGFKLYAWVVMPEHVHLVIQTGSPALTVEQILRRIKSRFAREVLARWRELDAKILAKVTDENGVAHFWQVGGGYGRNLVTEAEWMEKIEYIHNNPVHRGLVGTPEDWRWSSARWYAGDRQVPTDEPLIDPLW